jgi:hypothetical protein
MRRTALASWDIRLLTKTAFGKRRNRCQIGSHRTFFSQHRHALTSGTLEACEAGFQWTNIFDPKQRQGLPPVTYADERNLCLKRRKSRQVKAADTLDQTVTMCVVMATWVIRSKICASRMIMTFLHCLQTKESECKIRSRQHTTHARTTTISRDGEAYSMGRVFLPLLRLKGFCLDVLHSRIVRWTKPLSTSLLLESLADLGRSKSQLIAENALLRKPLIILSRQVKRPACTRADRTLLVLLARVVRTWQQALYIVQPDTLLALAS